MRPAELIQSALERPDSGAKNGGPNAKTDSLGPISSLLKSSSFQTLLCFFQILEQFDHFESAEIGSKRSNLDV